MSSCEYCGSIIAPGHTVCPKCGASVKSGDISESVKEFEKLLIETSDTDNIDYLRKSSFEDASIWGKIGWIVLWIFTWPVMIFVYLISRNQASVKMLTPSEIKRSNIISNYLFTNDRKTLLEALIFIQTQIDILGEMKKDGYMQYWVNLWTSKAEQVYKKAQISVGEDEKIEEIYKKIKKESERLNGVKAANFSVKLVLASMVLIIAFISVAAPIKYVSRVAYGNNNAVQNPSVSGGVEPDTSVTRDSNDKALVSTVISRTEKHNEFANKNVIFSGILGQCFEMTSDKAIIDLTDNDTKMELTLTVKCKKKLSEEIDKKMEGKLPEYELDDPLSGVFYINHPVGCYMSDYNLEGVVATELFNTLLNAQPGDEIEYHLIHILNDIYPPEEYTNIMTSSTLAVGMTVTYSYGHGDDFIYVDVK